LFSKYEVSSIEFKELNPIMLLSHIDNEFDLVKKIAKYSKSCLKVFEQYMILIVIAGTVIFATIVLGLFYQIPTLKPKVKEKAKEMEKKMLFNGIIRSVQVSYMKNCVGYLLVFQSLIKDEETP